jgi:anti-sigma B factor antagonist
MNEADLSITIEGDSILVKVRGEIDLQNAPQLANFLSSLRGDTTVDCSGLDFIDSTGLRVFMQAQKAFEERGDRLAVRNVPTHIRRIFDVAGVSAFLDIE